MTFAEMIRGLGVHLGAATIDRIGLTDDIYYALDRAQDEVEADAVNWLKIRAAASMLDTEPPRYPASFGTQPIRDSANCKLPEYYHECVVVAAARRLAETHPDINPKLKVPERLDGLYARLMQKANKRYAQELNASLPSAMVDAYDPDRHEREEF